MPSMTPPAPTAQAVQRTMEKKAVVLLALRPELTAVTWTWAPVSGQGLSGQLTEAEADALLAAGGMTEGIKAMGGSPAALARLLSWLESRTLSLTVERLYALTRDAAPETAAEELVCNVTFGADGARSASVYQRRADGVYLGTHSAEDLPDFFNWGGKRLLVGV